MKELIASLIRYAGLSSLIRRVCARRACTILYYHAPAYAVMESHLEYLQRHYHFITLDQLLTAIRTQDAQLLPDYSLVVTIDDGIKSNYDLLPLFRAYHVQPTIYLVSQVVGTNHPFWFNLPGIDKPRLKRLPHEDRIKILRDECGYDLQAEQAGGKTREALSADEIEQMKGWVDFQAHTCTHTILTTCADATSEREIRQCRDELEQQFGVVPQHFSFPNGDYSEREVEYVRNAGYVSARTVDVGWNSVQTDPFRLKAFEVPDDASVNMLAAKMTGIPGYFFHLRMGSLSGRRVATKPGRANATDV